MSVDKTIEELSSTLAQLGTLVGHINSQVVGITSRINLTLDTFDNSVAGVASDASAMTSQVALAVSQVPNSWIFYLLFITLIIVFILLSIILTINLLTKCHAIYRLVKDLRRPDSPLHSKPNSSELPTFEDSKPFVYSPSPQLQPASKGNHIAIPMEHEPRRVGYPANGDLRSHENSFVIEDEYRQPYQRRANESNSGRYNVQSGVALPYSCRGADV